MNYKINAVNRNKSISLKEFPLIGLEFVKLPLIKLILYLKMISSNLIQKMIKIKWIIQHIRRKSMGYATAIKKNIVNQ